MAVPDKFYFDGWSLDTRSGELQRDGTIARLSEQPLRILIELAMHAGEVVTREQLIQRLWPEGVVDFDAGLNTAMRKLRVALDDVGEKPRYIETLPRRGYRFIGKLERRSSPGRDVASTDVQAVTRRVSGGASYALAITAGLVVLAIAAVSLRMPPTTKPNDSSPARVRMAIVPFENSSPDPDNAFFTAGLHEQTLAVLSQRARSIEVISLATMRTFKDRPTATELSRILGATHVLTGTVRRDIGEVRLAVELIDARKDRHLWSHTFKRKLNEATTLQADVAAEVAAQLSSHLDNAAAQAKMTRNLEAYDLYLKALQESAPSFGAIDRTARPVALLTQAIERDPDFAQAYSERAVANLLAFIGNWDVSSARLDLVKQDIDAARRLAPSDPVIRALHAPYTAFVLSDPKRALEEVAEGAQLGHPDALEMQSLMLWSMGRPLESDAVCRRILELDPLNQSIRARRVTVLYAARQWPEALEAAKDIAGETNDLGEILRFEITGESHILASSFDKATTFSDLGRNLRDPEVNLSTYLMYMRVKRRFREAQQFLKEFPLATVRGAPSAGGALPGIGSRPVDEYRAWFALLSAEPAEAVRYAKGVRAFLRDTRETPWNTWFLRLLAAEAELFEGNKDAAARTAREVLAMPPARESNVRAYRYRERMAAAVLAWAGAEDDAVKLLRSLAYDVPVIGAASVARDPLFSLPLADNRDYRALQETLEKEIRSLR